MSDPGPVERKVRTVFHRREIARMERLGSDAAVFTAADLQLAVAVGMSVGILLALVLVTTATLRGPS